MLRTAQAQALSLLAMHSDAIELMESTDIRSDQAALNAQESGTGLTAQAALSVFCWKFAFGKTLTRKLFLLAARPKAFCKSWKSRRKATP